jgi:putative ATP-binding cassette transporter
MKFISFVLPHSRATVIAAILAGVVSGLSQTGLLALITTTLSGGHNALTLRLLWGFVALGFIMLMSRIASGVLLTRLSQNAIYHLRIDFSRQIMSASLRHLEKMGTPRVLAVLTEDIPALASALATIPTVCMHVAVVGGCLIYLGWLSWPVLLGLIPFIAIGVLAYRMIVSSAMRALTAARQQHVSLLRQFRALTEGIKELKLHRRRGESFLSRSLEPTAAALRQHNSRGSIIFTAAQGWGQLLSYILIGLVIFALPSFIGIDLRLLTGYALVIFYMLTPLEVILAALPTFARANIAVQNIEGLGISLLAKTSESDESRAIGAPAEISLKSLELSGVTHVYHREREDNDFVLGPIDLTFHTGELIFLVGGNGSGKTTLGKLLTGLYVPEAGEIRLNGKLITDLNRNDYRQYFSAVFSDFYLFESLLGLDAPQLDMQAREYLAQLQLDHKVTVTQGKFSSLNLSQGQRKRLALLAAYLEDRPVYVFDEWAADQDPQFKDVFYVHLLPELKSRGKTVVVISHDDRFYYLADRIVRLDYGKLISDSELRSAMPARIIEAV